MPILMALAETVDKLHAICMVCGEPACRTQRLVDGQPAHYNDPVVNVGASESMKHAAENIIKYQRIKIKCKITKHFQKKFAL